MTRDFLNEFIQNSAPIRALHLVEMQMRSITKMIEQKLILFDSLQFRHNNNIMNINATFPSILSPKIPVYSQEKPAESELSDSRNTEIISALRESAQLIVRSIENKKTDVNITFSNPDEYTPSTLS